MITPDESFGQAVYDHLRNQDYKEVFEDLGAGCNWVELHDDGRNAFTGAAMAAIEAYDRHLTADADAYADQVAAIPSFADQVAQAVADAAAMRPDGWISR